MSKFFCKLFTPWRAAAYFDDKEQFQDFLLKVSRRLNTFRIVMFAITAICLIVAYMYDQVTLNYVGVGFLVFALGATVVIGENDKQLPEELRQQ